MTFVELAYAENACCCGSGWRDLTFIGILFVVSFETRKASPMFVEREVSYSGMLTKHNVTQGSG